MANRSETPPDQDPAPEQQTIDHSQISAPASRFRMKRRIAVSAGVFVLLLLLVFGGVVLRLHYAPVSISSFRGEIEDFVAQTLPEGQTMQMG